VSRALGHPPLFPLPTHNSHRSAPRCSLRNNEKHLGEGNSLPGVPGRGLQLWEFLHQQYQNLRASGWVGSSLEASSAVPGLLLLTDT
jgi:hypothetical protein